MEEDQPGTCARMAGLLVLCMRIAWWDQSGAVLVDYVLPLTRRIVGCIERLTKVLVADTVELCKPNSIYLLPRYKYLACGFVSERQYAAMINFIHFNLADDILKNSLFVLAEYSCSSTIHKIITWDAGR